MGSLKDTLLVLVTLSHQSGDPQATVTEAYGLKQVKSLKLHCNHVIHRRVSVCASKLVQTSRDPIRSCPIQIFLHTRNRLCR